MDYNEIEEEIYSLLELGHNNDSSIQSVAASRYIDYAASIILGRAIPDINDGLKPVHRRILQTMKELHLSPTGAPKKSARVVGQTLGLYHPHGDTSVYEAMVGLTQPWSKMLPLVIGQGNFGSIDGDNAAAQRYTEVKLSKPGQMFFKDIDKNIIDFKDNYDATEKEPVVLPVPFPNLLINGASGIAAGMATNIPTHNPKEVINALIYVVQQKIKNAKISPEKILSFIPAPDFPSGGIVYNTQNMLKIITTGQGSVKIRANFFIEDLKRGKKALIINEIPYLVNKSKVVKEIAFIAKEKLSDSINVVRDESNKSGMRIYIELKQGVDIENIWHILLKHTSLNISINYNMIVTKDRSPLETNFIEVLESFVDFRKNIIKRKYESILNSSSSKLEIIEGLILAIKNIDDLINIIKTSKSELEAISSLKEKFSINDNQSKAILAIRIQKLIGLNTIELEQDRKSLIDIINEAKEIIDSDELKFKMIIKESREIRKELNIDRKTEIDSSEFEINTTKAVPVKDTILYFTRLGYIKSGPKEIALKDKDIILYMIKTNTAENVYFITKNGNIFAKKVYDIPEQNDGRYIGNIINLSHDDKVVAIVQDSQEWIICTKNGFVKKTKPEYYSAAFRNPGTIVAKLKDRDEIIYAEEIKEEYDSVLFSATNKKLIKFSIDSVPETKKSSTGVIGMKLKDGDKIISASLVNDNYEVVNVTEYGGYKSQKVKDIKTQGRAGMGVLHSFKSEPKFSVIKKINSKLILELDNGDETSDSLKKNDGKIVENIKIGELDNE